MNFKEIKLPVPKTLRGAFSPIILINWAVGLGVFEFPTGRPRPVISAAWTITNFLMYLGFVKMGNFFEMHKVQGSRIAASNYRMNIFIISSFIVISMCLAQAKAKLLNDSYLKVIALNERLKILGIPNDYDSIFKTQIIELFVALVYIFTTMTMTVKFISADVPIDVPRIGSCLTFLYMLVVADIVNFSFTTSVRYIRNRFQRLNELLAELDCPEKSETIVTEVSSNKFPRYPSVIKEIKRYNSLAIRAGNSRWLLHVLVSETRKIHWGLCKTAVQINRAHGIQALLLVALSFGIILTLLYRFYITITISSSSFSSILEGVLPIINALMWIAFFAFEVSRVVRACETTSHEANRTGELVAKLLITTSCDENIRDEMNIFLLQLVQNPLKFTAGGFFPLNYALIREMVGTLTTYLVIMIQMQSIYDPEMAN